MVIKLAGLVLLAAAIIGSIVALALMLRRRATEKREALRMELKQWKEIEQSVRARDASLHAIIENTDAILLILNPEGEFLFCEGRGSLLLGDLTKGIVGRTIQQVFHERPDVLTLFERCRSGESLNTVLPILGNSFQMLANPVHDREGTLESIVAILLDVTGAEEMRRRLAESEEKYRTIFDNAPIGIFRSTFSGDMVDVNPAMIRMLGYGNREEFLEATQGRSQSVYTNDAARQRLLDAQFASPKGACLETEFKRKDGTPFVAGIRASLRCDAAGNPLLIEGTIEDISERKRFEEVLRESESRLRALYRSIPDLVWLKNPDGVFLICNPAFEKFFGFHEVELIGKTDYDIVPKELADFFRAHDRKAMQADRSLKNEEWLTSCDGYQGLFETVKTPMRDAAGKVVGVLGVSRDITPRVEAEKEIREWMQRFEIITSAALLVFYDCDVNADFVLWTGATREVLGYAQGEMKGPVQKWVDMLHPDEASELLQRFNDAKGKCKRFEEEYRLRHKAGHYIHVYVSGVFLPDASGRAFRMLGILQDISARKNAELALAASEKRYRVLFESTHVAILILDGERIVECNPGAHLLFGRDRSEIIGKTPAECSPRQQPNGESSLAMMRWMLAQVADGTRQAFDWVLERPDGALVWTDYSLASMDLGDRRYLVILAHDVTERRQAEILLKQSEEKFSKVFALAPYAILVIRISDNVVLDVNQAYQSVTGYSREEVLGRKTMDYIKWVDPAQQRTLASRLAQDGMVQDFEALLYRKNGAIRCVLISGLQTDIGGELCRIIISRDITELKLAQQNMIQSEKMMSVGGLAAGMAHEINNPLSIVLQSVRGMQRRLDPNFPANQGEAQALGVDLSAVHAYLERRNILAYMDGIADAGQRAAEIVRNMLNFSRKSDTSVVECDLAALVRQAVHLAEQDYDLKKKYDFKKIAVNLEVKEGFPLVPCVPTEIEQVLLNLLRNAAQAMTQAKTPAPAITIRIDREKDHAVLTVQDNGPGIPASELLRVFEPFFTTKKIGEGTGLGLSVSYYIITTTHKGTMHVESNPGQGARFVVRLPL